MTPTELRSLDLTTLNAVQEFIVAHLQSKVCQWEQEASDAAQDEQLNVALMKQNWAFATDLVASSCGWVMTDLFIAACKAKAGEPAVVELQPELVAA